MSLAGSFATGSEKGAKRVEGATDGASVHAIAMRVRSRAAQTFLIQRAGSPGPVRAATKFMPENAAAWQCAPLARNWQRKLRTTPRAFVCAIPSRSPACSGTAPAGDMLS